MYNAFVIKDADIDGCTYSADGSNASRLVFMVPFESEKKMAVLLRKLESFPDVIVAVEVTSLEDAYLKIVKQEDVGFRKDDEQI